MLSVSTQLAPGESLRQCEQLLKSVTFADQITLYNFGRTDAEFFKLAKKYHVQVIELKKPYPPVVEYIRAQEVKDAKHDWVLVLDYDEVVTPALAKEIRSITSSVVPPRFAAYDLPRRNYSLGFPLRYGGFGDDKVLRLFHRQSFLSWPRDIHSTPTYAGELGHLKTFLEHHKDESLSQMVNKTNRYTAVEAQQFFQGNSAQVTTLTLLRKTIMEFVRRYFLKLGILDGRIGLIQAIYQSYSIFLRYAKLYELQNKMKIENN